VCIVCPTFPVLGIGALRLILTRNKTTDELMPSMRFFVDDVEVSKAEYEHARGRWYTSGDGCDCATGDEYYHGYEVHCRAKDPTTAEMICEAVNRLRTSA
jgi:hypothetical protein